MAFFQTDLNDALLFVTQQIQDNLDKGYESRLIALDLSAAFDRVWHTGLLVKLKDCGIAGKLLSWFESYLSNRFRQVIVGGRSSRKSPIISGVPQGSVLGPTLFLIFAKDIAENLENTMISYADDCTLFSTITSPRQRLHCAASLQRDLNKLASWAENWKLNFNASKTQSIIISRPRTTDPPHAQLKFLGESLKDVDSIKIWGVTLDAKLSWTQHISNLALAASRKLGMMRKAKWKNLDCGTTATIYKSFIRPNLEYCSPVWGTAAKSKLEILDRLQSKSVVSIPPNLYAELGIQPLSHRRRVAGFTVFKKIQCSLLPHLLDSLKLPLQHGALQGNHVHNIKILSSSPNHALLNIRDPSYHPVPGFGTHYLLLPL